MGLNKKLKKAVPIGTASSVLRAGIFFLIVGGVFLLFFRFHFDLFEIGGGVLAEGADIVRREGLSFVFEAADDTAPDCLCFFLGGWGIGGVGGCGHAFGICCGLGLICRVGCYFTGGGLDIIEIVLVCGGGGIREYLTVGNVTDKHGMGTQIHGVQHFDGDGGIRSFCDGKDTVFASFTMGEVFELIGIFSRREAEVDKEVEIGILADYREGELSRSLDHTVGKIILIDTDGDPIGHCCDLTCGIDDASVIFSVFRCCQNEEAVAEFEHCFVIHFSLLFAV